MNPMPARPDLGATLRKLAGVFFTGLVAVLPILVTIALVMWLVRAAESVLGGMLGILLPSSLYLPGMGLVLAIGIIFLVGLGLQGVMFRGVMRWRDAGATLGVGGGPYSLLLPRSYLTPLDMSFEEAMRFVITAGISRHNEAGAAPGKP